MRSVCDTAAGTKDRQQSVPSAGARVELRCRGESLWPSLSCEAQISVAGIANLQRQLVIVGGHKIVCMECAEDPRRSRHGQIVPNVRRCQRTNILLVDTAQSRAHAEVCIGRGYL